MFRTTQTTRQLDRIKGVIHSRLASAESEKETSDEENDLLPGARRFGSVHVIRVRPRSGASPGANPHFRGSEV